MKFYLSSTFKDLQQERQAAKDAFQKVGYQCVCSEPASHREVVERCLKEVEMCDALLLLLGTRYGTLRKNPTTGENLSITHHEFRHARDKNKGTSKNY